MIPPASSGGTRFDVTVPYPVLIKGRLTDPDGVPVPGASVRALLPLPDKPNVVIVIGEAMTGPDGAYLLPLPPSLTDGFGASDGQ